MSARKKNDITFDIIKDTYIGVLKKYTVIKGRAGRREFWIFFFINLVLGLIPGINFIVTLLTFIPGITVGVRRLHDTNRSGLWFLLGLIPFVGLIILLTGLFTLRGGGLRIRGDGLWFFSGGFWFLYILIIIASLVAAIILLVWAAQEGTRGKNKYGTDPKAKSKK